MWGLTRKNLRLNIGLLIATAALAVGWSYLPHLVFVIVIITLILPAVIAVIARNTWRQTARDVPDAYDEPAAAASPGTPGRLRQSPPARRARGGTRSRKDDDLLDADATVTLADERLAAGVDEVLAALDNELVGLLPVKRKVEEIASLLLVDRARQRFGLSAPRPNLHMCFTGAPGTGKTTVALRMADLLGEYIGQTAPQTRRVLDRAMGGILFIDEAYDLYRASDSKDYGQECIDILLQVMENERDKLVVIVAGYKDRMDEFFASNPGMSSRIAHHLDFAPYQLDELVAIGRVMLARASYYPSDDAEAAFRDYLTLRMGQPRFANARSVRNELERARLRHAHRLASDPELRRSKDDLMRIEPADIFASPAFAERPAAGRAP